ncbi:MAG: hypothetical protein KGY41_00670 [Desulfovermiculus sp.]|nr:hypothetical protein [Desulfovermiculus sp.]
MADPRSGVQTLSSGTGQAVGVFIPIELWTEVQAEVLPLLQVAWERLHGGQQKVEPAEPIDDWKLLLDHWDFKYPVERKVACGHCGQTTDNWQEDLPRKFVLKSASLGGLVTFECQVCQSRVIKRHFKDGIKEETTPRKP